MRRPPTLTLADTVAPNTTFCRSGVGIVGENAVEADIFESRFVMHQPHLVLVFLAQQQAGMTRAHAILPRLAHGARDRVHVGGDRARILRSEEHTSELQSLMRLSYAVFCLQ